LDGTWRRYIMTAHVGRIKLIIALEKFISGALVEINRSQPKSVLQNNTKAGAMRQSLSLWYPLHCWWRWRALPAAINSFTLL